MEVSPAVSSFRHLMEGQSPSINPAGAASVVRLLELEFQTERLEGIKTALHTLLEVKPESENINLFEKTKISSVLGDIFFRYKHSGEEAKQFILTECFDCITAYSDSEILRTKFGKKGLVIGILEWLEQIEAPIRVLTSGAEALCSLLERCQANRRLITSCSRFHDHLKLLYRLVMKSDDPMFQHLLLDATWRIARKQPRNVLDAIGWGPEASNLFINIHSKNYEEGLAHLHRYLNMAPPPAERRVHSLNMKRMDIKGCRFEDIWVYFGSAKLATWLKEDYVDIPNTSISYLGKSANSFHFKLDSSLYFSNCVKEESSLILVVQEENLPYFTEWILTILKGKQKQKSSIASMGLPNNKNPIPSDLLKLTVTPVKPVPKDHMAPMGRPKVPSGEPKGPMGNSEVSNKAEEKNKDAGNLDLDENSPESPPRPRRSSARKTRCDPAEQETPPRSTRANENVPTAPTKIPTVAVPAVPTVTVVPKAIPKVPTVKPGITRVPSPPSAGIPEMIQLSTAKRIQEVETPPSKTLSHHVKRRLFSPGLDDVRFQSPATTGDPLTDEATNLLFSLQSVTQRRTQQNHEKIEQTSREVCQHLQENYRQLQVQHDAERRELLMGHKRVLDNNQNHIQKEVKKIKKMTQEFCQEMEKQQKGRKLFHRNFIPFFLAIFNPNFQKE